MVRVGQLVTTSAVTVRTAMSRVRTGADCSMIARRVWVQSASRRRGVQERSAVTRSRWPRLDDCLLPGAIVWFGETHGTEQSPRFVGDVAEDAARRGRVQLALEYPCSLQPQLD